MAEIYKGIGKEVIYVAHVIETERGWGAKIDETHEFQTEQEQGKQLWNTRHEGFITVIDQQMKNPLYPRLGDTPNKLVVISGVTKRYRISDILFTAHVDYVWHHVYARILVCKLRSEPCSK